jgi:UDP-N-acetylglucosamine--N-acetylmuramyl-(pentapeptide) pyrophosphoryl-undecaprenol N-acetylglucosamine transferase
LSLQDTSFAVFMNNQTFKVVFAAGGTGGHLFPAIAVAEELQQLTEGRTIIEFVGTADRIEATVVPNHHYRFHAIPMAGLQKLVSLDTLKLPFKILRSLLLCRQILQRLQPHCVVCTGAYLSYPVGLAASQLGIPLVLMESNAFPGKTIAQLAPRATKLYLSFEESLAHFPAHLHTKAEITGNPIRANFSVMPSQAEARRLFGLDATQPTILCFGGSLGAHSINAAVERHRERFAQSGVQVIWQTGKHFQPALPSDATTKVMPFIDNMAAAYAAADVVVCRAGATTIAELACIQKLSIFVPFPHAANDHQTANARALAEQGAALVLLDNEVQERLFETVMPLLDNPAQTAQMAVRMAHFAKPDAARHIASSLLAMAGWTTP